MDEDPESPAMELCSRRVSLEYGFWPLAHLPCVADVVPRSGILGSPTFREGPDLPAATQSALVGVGAIPPSLITRADKVIE